MSEFTDKLFAEKTCGDKFPNMEAVITKRDELCGEEGEPYHDINEEYWRALPVKDGLHSYYVYNKGNDIEVKIEGESALDAAIRAVKKQFEFSEPINYTDVFHVDERGFRGSRSQYKFAAQEVLSKTDFDGGGSFVYTA